MAGNSGTAKGTAKGRKTVGGRSLEGSHDDIPAASQNAKIEAMAKNAGLSKDEAAKSFKSIKGFTSKSDVFRAVERGDQKILKSLSPEKRSYMEDRINEINNYITKAPSYKGEIYRGLAFNNEQERTAFLKSFGSKPLNAMSSFSSDESVAHLFSHRTDNYYGVVLKVTNNKSGASIKNVSKHSFEDEVLVPKGTKYKIARILPQEGSQPIVVEIREV